MTTTAITGWAGRWASKIDAADPGFFGELYRAPPVRRQVIFAVLAKFEIGCGLPDDLTWLGGHLRCSKGSVLVQEAYGSDPSGYRHALSKLGGGPAKPSLYKRLHEEFDRRSDPHLLKLISHLKSTDERLLQVITDLPPEARHPGIVNIVATAQGARHMAAFVEAIQTYCSVASAEQLSTSLRRVKNHDDLHNWMQRWLLKADQFPEPPWAGTKHLQPITSASEMTMCAGEFQNCLKDQVTAVLDGECYFYVWRRDRQAAVVKLAQGIPRPWAVGEVLGRHNRKVPPVTLNAIRAEFAEAGLKFRTPLGDSMSEIWSAAQLRTHRRH